MALSGLSDVKNPAGSGWAVKMVEKRWNEHNYFSFRASTLPYQMNECRRLPCYVKWWQRTHCFGFEYLIKDLRACEVEILFGQKNLSNKTIRAIAEGVAAPSRSVISFFAFSKATES